MNYTKHNITTKEVEITSLASANDIAPKLVSSDEKSITLQAWPSTLIEIPLNEWIFYKDVTVNNLRKLHSLGIIHGDLSEENIVVDPSTKDAKLIDFGMSKYVSSIDIEEFNVNNDFDAKSHEDLFAYDLQDIRLLFGTL